MGKREEQISLEIRGVKLSILIPVPLKRNLSHPAISSHRGRVRQTIAPKSRKLLGVEGFTQILFARVSPVYTVHHVRLLA
jgi:hypothetical protein